MEMDGCLVECVCKDHKKIQILVHLDLCRKLLASDKVG